MFDAILHSVQQIVAFAQSLLGPKLTGATGWALALSIGSTQFVKMLPFVAHIPSKRTRWLTIWTYAISVCLGVMLLMYDEPDLARRVVVSLSIAFLPPLAYLPIAWIVWRFAPHIGKAMSGDPRYLDLPPTPEEKNAPPNH